MTEAEAKALAERIRSQFPFHHVAVYERSDMQYWFLSIRASEDAERSLIVRDERDWERILFALQLLKD